MKAHYECLSAKTYYGKHATGSVILMNGTPLIHGKTSEIRATYKTIFKGQKKES